MPDNAESNLVHIEEIRVLSMLRKLGIDATLEQLRSEEPLFEFSIKTVRRDLTFLIDKGILSKSRADEVLEKLGQCIKSTGR